MNDFDKLSRNLNVPAVTLPVGYPELETFLNMPTAQVAQLVRDAGPHVCVCPIDGTRRWFLMEHGEGNLESYLDASMQNFMQIITLFFEHGLDTLLIPLAGADQLKRGPSYLPVIVNGIERMANDPTLLGFYATQKIQVHFYGDYCKALTNLECQETLGLIKQVKDVTRDHTPRRLFYGVFVDDPTETIARLTVEHYQKYGQIPDRRRLVELYYGEYVDPVSLYIGYDAFCAFDMPLVSTGQEDLYFTVCPTPYFTSRQLRMILYDHLYNRRIWHSPETAQSAPQLVSDSFARLQQFCQANRDHTLGVGAIYDGIWYPQSQVAWPEGFGGM